AGRSGPLKKERELELGNNVLGIEAAVEVGEQNRKGGDGDAPMPIVEGLDEPAHVNAARVDGHARRKRRRRNRRMSAAVGEVNRNWVAEVADSGLVKKERDRGR